MSEYYSLGFSDDDVDNIASPYTNESIVGVFDRS
jgi:hypothetical protein